MIKKIEQIKKFIFNGKVRDALEELLGLVKEINKDIYNEALLQSAKYHQVRRHLDKGIITSDEAFRIEYSINYSIIQLADELQELAISIQVDNVLKKGSNSRSTILQPEITTSRLFLHYFDHYFLEMKGLRGKWRRNELSECKLATKLALLAADEILIPASSYFESNLCRKVVDEFKALFETGSIWLVAKAYDANDYSMSKLEEYKKNSSQYNLYKDVIRGNIKCPPFLTRKNRATKEIVTGWNALLETEMPEIIYNSLKLDIDIKTLEKSWKNVPDRLGSLAFVVEHVKPLTIPQKFEKHHGIDKFLHSIINQFYFKSFTDEFESGVVKKLVYLNSPFQLYSLGKNLLFSTTKKSLISNDLYKEIMNCPVKDLLKLKEDAALRSIIKLSD